MNSQMNWPSDEIKRDKEYAKQRHSSKKDLLKIVIAFADEAVILLLIIYIAYRFFGSG